MAKPKSSKIPHVLMLGDISQSGWKELCMGFSKYARVHGGWVLYLNSPYYRNPNLKSITVKDIWHWHVNGIFNNLTNPAKTREIIALDLPTVVVCGIQKEVLGKHSILYNNKLIGEMGFDHLMEKKFRNFAYCGFDYMYWSGERGNAFVDSAAKAGRSVYIYKQPCKKNVYSWENELAYMAKWLKTLPTPIGLMACNDDRGRQVLEACRFSGLLVPDDVAVLSVDNDDYLCEVTNLSLSSIYFNLERIGYQADELLDRLMHGEKVPSQTLLVEPMGIKVRQSTDVMALDDDIVKQAVRFIRLNCMKPINVADVAMAMFQTTRTLQRRFNKALGRSVHNEIIRVRLEQACQMLIETNLSISQIALKLGYSEIRYFTQAFKREKGIGPLAFRKAYGNM